MTPIFIKVTGTPTDEEDVDVVGHYRIDVQDHVPADRIVTAAKDVFHANIAIACLDDFDIATFDATGAVVEEPDGADTGSLEWEKGGVLSYIDEADFPNMDTATPSP